MGRSIKVRYSVHYKFSGIYLTPAAWRPAVQGKPTTKNLAMAVAVLLDSFKVGGCNEHIKGTGGGIPIPTYAWILDNQTGNVVAEWTAPNFLVI